MTNELNLTGGAQSGSIEVTEKGARLPKQTARFVMLSNWSVQDDSSYSAKPSYDETNNVINGGATDAAQPPNTEIYFGFGGNEAHQLFAGQTTVLIPVSDLSQITVRTRPNQRTTIFFSWFF